MTATIEWLETDYYKALGVSETASDEEIRKAYRKLARAAHPDTNPDDPGAEARFKEISAAYDVIGDADTRKEYDELRRRGAMAGPGFGGGGYRVHVNDIDVDDLSGFADAFGSWFGAQGPAGPRPGTPRPRPGHDLTANLRLGFVEAVYGTAMTIELMGEADCTDCLGTGIAGAGARIERRCPTCQGQGRVRRPRKVKVRIPAGVDDGQTIRLPGRGAPGSNGGPAGDLFVTVDVDPHPEFGRIGRNLTLTVPVTYAEAVLGADVTVPTLDGSTVTVRVPAGTPPGRTLRVSGKGVPKPGNTGDLLLTIDIEVPQDLTAAERRLVEQLGAAGSHRRPRARWEPDR